jgi:hypothetical protein
MSKTTGLGWTTLDIDDSGGTPQDCRPGVTNFEFATPREVQDVTGLDKSAMERLLLLADFSIGLNGTFDDATADTPHEVLRTVPSSDVARTTTIEVDGTAGTNTLANEVLYTDYQITRSDSGALTFSAPGVLSDGTVPTWSQA